MSAAFDRVELADVSRHYGRRRAVTKISFTVARGEILGLLGPNGAGKSTLLAAITGTIRDRRGKIVFENDELIDRAAHAIVAAGVRLVPEGRLVFAPFSVEDNLRLGAVRLNGDLDERFEYVYRLFPRLSERRKQPAGTLSGGEQQMLAIGRCLMGAPELVMFDEPSLGLAPTVVQQVLRTIRDLNREGLTCVLVEQNVAVSLKLAARAYVLENGRITISGAGEELLADDRVRQAYLGM